MSGYALMVTGLTVCCCLTACAQPERRSSHAPITSASLQQIPPRQCTIRVIAEHPTVLETATRWVNDHGYLTSTHDAAVVLRLDVREESAIYGGRAPVIQVLGTDGASGRLLLESRAAMPVAGRSDQLLRELTCQALATAWGYRPSGQLNIPGPLMCTVGTKGSSRARQE